MRSPTLTPHSRSLRALHPCVSSNAGAHAGWSPVWAAPGDLCDMQRHMAGPTIRFHHCSEDGYATDYKLEDHVKLCLNKEEIDWLWNHGKHGSPVGHHCQNGEGEPHLGPEGLLVCCTPAECEKEAISHWGGEPGAPRLIF